jgi:hypothetical protein
MVVGTPFSKRDYERLGVDLFIKKGFDVEVWDCTALVMPFEYHQYVPPDPFGWENCYKYKSKREFLRAVERLDRRTFAILHISYNLHCFTIFKEISRKIKYSVMAFSLPGLESVSAWSQNRTHRYFQYIARFFTSPTDKYFGKIIKKIFVKIPHFLLGIKSANIVLLPASKNFIEYPVDSKSKFVRAHMLDYDNYLKIAGDSPAIIEKTAIFLDEFAPFHSDYLHRGSPSDINPEEYYSLLCKLFSCLESKHGFKVVVAAHPKSSYDELPEYYQGRPIIRGKTAELVKDSSLVILHHSLSYNYAVLFKKPMIFITTSQYQKNFSRGLKEPPTIEWLAAYFRKGVHNLDHFDGLDMEHEMEVDITRYDEFRDNYIKMDGSEEIPLWEILIKVIEDSD